VSKNSVINRIDRWERQGRKVSRRKVKGRGGRRSRTRYPFVERTFALAGQIECATMERESQ